MRIIGTRKPARIGDATYDFKSSHYCGPTSLSAITGLGTATLTKMVRKIRSRSGRDSAGVKGMYNSEMLHVLKLLKYKAEPAFSAHGANAGTRVTFSKWADYHADRTSVYLVQITGHFLVYQAGIVSCTSKRGRMHPLSENAHLRKTVKTAWRIS